MIKIVCDSSCDYRPDKAEETGFSLVPLTVAFGEDTFRENLDIDTKTFFYKLGATKSLPKTSQPSPEAFMSEFRGLNLTAADEIICICVTSKASGTYNSALTAKQLLKEEGFAPKIYVIDSLNASGAIALFAEKACAMAREGKNAEEIVLTLNTMVQRAAIYFVLDTLEYVKRGGRIGNVKAMVGQLLNIKPLLTFIEGFCVDIGKTRGMAQAKKQLLEKFSQTAESFSEVTVLYAEHIQIAHELMEDFKNTYAQIKITLVEVGAVMGTYTGPGAVGISFVEKKARW